MRRFEAKARLVDEARGKFVVNFAGPAVARYWILFVDEDYSIALVGAKTRDKLWLLSRDSSLQAEDLETLKAEAVRLGFDLDKLILGPEARRLEGADD